MKYREFKRNMLDRYCRQCINNQLGVNLVAGDCIYNIYQNPCQCCGRVKNIVGDIRWTGKVKIKRGKE